MKRTTLLLALAAPVALAGCGGFNQEAGAFLDGGTFGNATMHNHLVATCQATSHDKYSGGAGGRCAPRTLDGKYARTSYNEYVTDGRQIPQVITSFRGATPGGGNAGGG